ncbi:MAG: diaminopimelate epimerase [Pseudomonadota bacterium]
MKVPFQKMHGLGNDFVIIDRRADAALAALPLSSEQVRALGCRTTGIGFDQLLCIDPPSQPAVNADYLIFNADGAAVEQCGNGVRCVAAAIQRRDGLTAGTALRLNSPSGLVIATLSDNDQVSVDMGVPDFTPAAIPLAVPAAATIYETHALGQSLKFSAVSIGNPHAVLIVDDVDTAAVGEIGPALQTSPLFPDSVNVGFAMVVDRQHVRLRVYERGVGETRACGTGACAAMVSLRHRDLIDARAEIALPGGVLVIDWPQLGEPVIMSGPAAFAYEGSITL